MKLDPELVVVLVLAGVVAGMVLGRAVADLDNERALAQLWSRSTTGEAS